MGLCCELLGSMHLPSDQVTDMKLCEPGSIILAGWLVEPSVDWTQTGSAWRKNSLKGEINPTNRINCTISCGDKGSRDIKNEIFKGLPVDFVEFWWEVKWVNLEIGA
ncbi:hypothetical protein NC652_011646 [Populus alba x Populus x berolinensis]|nr:hypothetical protein NC652_011646 [Populus alba x Populus x berolinensis]